METVPKINTYIHVKYYADEGAKLISSRSDSIKEKKNMNKHWNSFWK
jgi:hypothetical protein